MKTLHVDRNVVLLIALCVLVGWLLGAQSTPSAEAQQGPQQFSECMSLSVHSHNGAAFANPRWTPRTIQIRPGWTAVGGSGSGTRNYAIVCR
ncbi:MAG: hypothetical protein H6719_08990 [Sandaracinaceae bacterium]|nr:hypothetical protein [Sandaracinaceae bacterium]